jgi:hypothetical protein
MSWASAGRVASSARRRVRLAKIIPIGLIIGNVLHELGANFSNRLSRTVTVTGTDHE